ncbi:MAG: cellulase family glycosylhydrolase [Bdellovibrionales bacterium]|nr:cellulase family glycosylhydrolase [Bdellovibrionales bacterium]
MRLGTAIIAISFAAIAAVSCSSSTEELLDILVDPPERKEIDVSQMGVNNFFLASEFGSFSDQFLEIRDTLGLKFVRILFAWSNDVQPSPDADPFYGFYDAILDAVPPGVDVLPVLVHTPDWMADSANWIDGNPRTTWVERWLRPTVARYAGRSSIVGWEVWNEPDLTVVPSDFVLGLEEPGNYVELLSAANTTIRSLDPTKLIVIAATESINQDFPNNLNYNKDLQMLGADALVDIWNIHYYGEQYERVVVGGGIADFLGGLSKAVWVTESGEPSAVGQLPYVETAWPFLREKIPNITRIYYYRYANSAGDLPYGLRQGGETVSDLYIHLRDR